MEYLSIKEIQKIDKSTTTKLLKYISKELKDETMLESIEFYYPDFGEQKYTVAFNVWLSIDFMDTDGKTFIEKFLEKNPRTLTKYEKEILIERKISNLSIFEILYIDNKTLKVLDLLQNMEYNVYEPELASTLVVGDFIMARLGTMLGTLHFIGDINYIPSSTKSIFIEDIFIDLNHLRVTNPNLTIKTYLKKYSLHLYKMYTNCVFEAMEMTEDIVSIFYDELDQFEGFLNLKTDKSMVRNHIANLTDFFEYYLADNDLTLHDLDKIDLHLFFEEALEDGFIIFEDDLNSYIKTFKYYLKFLYNTDSYYKEIYKEILEISKNRFNLINKLKLMKSPFVIERQLSKMVIDNLNEDSISLISDFDKFMLFIIGSPLELTAKNKYIKRKNLIKMNSMMELSSYLKNQYPNQKDFPIIHMFYILANNMGLVNIRDNKLHISNKGNNYLRLREEDKYTMFFQHIWESDFLIGVCNIKNSHIFMTFKQDLIDLLSSMEENKNYEISNILPKFSKNFKLFFESYIYLQYLGIIKCNLYPSYEIRLTSLGKIIVEFLQSQDNHKEKCSIIDLNSFKKIT